MSTPLGFYLSPYLHITLLLRGWITKEDLRKRHVLNILNLLKWHLRSFKLS
jgi:hypothetical protein